MELFDLSKNVGNVVGHGTVSYMLGQVRWGSMLEIDDTYYIVGKRIGEICVHRRDRIYAAGSSRLSCGCRGPR